MGKLLLKYGITCFNKSFNVQNENTLSKYRGDKVFVTLLQ